VRSLPAFDFVVKNARPLEARKHLGRFERSRRPINGGSFDSRFPGLIHYIDCTGVQKTRRRR